MDFIANATFTIIAIAIGLMIFKVLGKLFFYFFEDDPNKPLNNDIAKYEKRRKN